MTATPQPWDEERRFHPILIGTVDDDDPLAKLWAKRQSTTTSEIGLFNELLSAARCVIYLEEGKDGPSLEVVFYAVDLRSAEMVLARPLRLFGFENDDDLKGHLARVLLEELPLVAETEVAQARLDALIRDLVVNGFSSKVDGKLVRLKMTDKGRAIDLDDPQVKPLGDGRLVPTLSETRLAIKSLREELDTHEAAARTLAALRLAIGELQEALDGDVEELVLQAVLTRHPVLSAQSTPVWCHSIAWARSS